MLKEIRLGNYKIFKELHTFCLRDDVSPLVYERGSGMTTLSEAILWCLTGMQHKEYRGYRNAPPLLNIQSAMKMVDGSTESVVVELTLEFNNEKVIFKREAVFRKENSGITKISETCFMPEGFAPSSIVAELMFWDNRLQDEKLDYKKLMARSENRGGSLRGTLSAKKQVTQVDENIASEIAEAATAIFSQLYFRAGQCKVKWEDGFQLYREDINCKWSGLSATDQLVFNLSIIIAMREKLLDPKSLMRSLPIVVDDIFMRCSPDGFAIGKLLSALPKQQVVLLLHESSFFRGSGLGQPLYYISRIEEGTNVSVERLRVELREAVHNCAIKWLRSVLSNRTELTLSEEWSPQGEFFRELQEIGLFSIDEDLPHEERDRLFRNLDDWHDVSRFAEIINSITDYKLVAYIILYKMRTVRNKIWSCDYREFFIVGFERLVGLTEKDSDM